MEPAATFLAEQLALKPYKAREFLDVLHEELTQFAKSYVLEADWGSLQLDEEGLWLSVEAKISIAHSERVRSKVVFGS